MKTETREQWVGAAAFFGLLALLVTLNQSGDVDSAPSDGYRLTALFNKIDGLAVGDEVRLAGIQVGKIEAFELDDRFRAKVSLMIEDGVAIPTDSSASIQTDGLFGAKFIVLEPGGEVEFLKAGGQIPLTQDSVVVSDLLDTIISEGNVALEERKQLLKEAQERAARENAGDTPGPDDGGPGGLDLTNPFGN